MTTQRTVLAGGSVFVDEVIKRADVLIAGERIEQVGLNLTAPSGTRVIDVAGKTVLPGLIDAHAHLAIGDDTVSDAALAIDAVAHAFDFLRAGITAVRDVGGSRHVDIELRDAIGAKTVPGPTMQCAGQSIVITGGHGHQFFRTADGISDVIKAVREQLLARCDLIKVICSGGVIDAKESEAWVQFTDGELAALMHEANAQGRPVAAHAHPATAIKRAVAFGAATIEHGSFLDDECADVMAERGVPVIPTFTVYRTMADHPAYPGVNARAKRVYEGKFEPFVRAVSRGVPWGVGSDYCALYARPDSLIDEIEILVLEASLPAASVLRAASQVNAGIMGLQDEIGVIAPGFRADLFIVDGDPLSDIKALRSVGITVRNGSVYEWSTGLGSVEEVAVMDRPNAGLL